MIIIAIVLFIIIETLNIATLYFKPELKVGNGIGVFKAFEASKQYPEIHDLIKYLINWVAGTKLIFICLLIVILFTGTDLTKYLAVIALILSILSFYWRLYPMMKTMDQKDQLSPKGYSKTLGIMITSFILVFVAAAIIGIKTIL